MSQQPSPPQAGPCRRRSSLPNSADDASDLIVDWDHRHRASVTYDGEEEEEDSDSDSDNDNDNDNDNEGEDEAGENENASRIANEEDTTAEQAQMGRPNIATGGTTIIDDPLPPRGSVPIAARGANSHAAAAAPATSRSSERQSLFDRIGALAAAAADGSSTNLGPSSAHAGAAVPNSTEEPAQQPQTDVVSSAPSEQPQAIQQQQAPPPPAVSRRTVRFQRHNRTLVVEGRHHYTPQEASATWYDGNDATAMRQTYTSDVRSMRRRIRRNVSLGEHTHDVHRGNYSERGLEHLTSTAVYQERTDDQSGTIQAVLVAQENYHAAGGGSRVGQRPRRVEGDGNDGNANDTVGNDNDDSHADQLARMYCEMCRETKERAEELGRADAEEAVRADERHRGQRWNMKG